MTIVINLQELKDNGTGLGAGLKGMQLDALRFEGAKKAFHDGVVVAIAFAAHADGEVVVS